MGQNNAGCNLVTVIAEYSAGKRPLQAKSVNPREVRRVLSFARPYSNHMGGHIFFGKDGLLYYTSGTLKLLPCCSETCTQPIGAALCSA